MVHHLPAWEKVLKGLSYKEERGGREGVLLVLYEGFAKLTSCWSDVGKSGRRGNISSSPVPSLQTPHSHIDPPLEEEGASPLSNPLCQNKGWNRDDSSCTVTSCTSSLPTIPGHSISVLIVFICRHKYERNFSHHPDSFLVPKCSLLHLHPQPKHSDVVTVQIFLGLVWEASS